MNAPPSGLAWLFYVYFGVMVVAVGLSMALAAYHPSMPGFVLVVSVSGNVAPSDSSGCSASLLPRLPCRWRLVRWARYAQVVPGCPPVGAPGAQLLTCAICLGAACAASAPRSRRCLRCSRLTTSPSRSPSRRRRGPHCRASWPSGMPSNVRSPVVAAAAASDLPPSRNHSCSALSPPLPTAPRPALPNWPRPHCCRSSVSAVAATCWV